MLSEYLANSSDCVSVEISVSGNHVQFNAHEFTTWHHCNEGPVGATTFMKLCILFAVGFRPFDDERRVHDTRDSSLVAFGKAETKRCGIAKKAFFRRMYRQKQLWHVVVVCTFVSQRVLTRKASLLTVWKFLRNKLRMCEKKSTTKLPCLVGDYRPCLGRIRSMHFVVLLLFAPYYPNIPRSIYWHLCTRYSHVVYGR